MHARADTFSYQCRACSRCCYDKRIQVNPYELARLARNRDTTTTDVIERFTVDGGTALATRSDGACVFLGATGCTVHADRPLVCRLYPLGRIVQADGSERFVENEPHPETEGVYGDDGSVGSYVDRQGVGPYIAAADRYYAIFTRLLSVGAGAPGQTPHRHQGDDSSGSGAVPDIDARHFIDADLALGADSTFLAEPGRPGVDELVERHLALIERWAELLVEG